MTKDPRLYQIIALTGLLVVGIYTLDFSIDAEIAATIIITALGTQYLISAGRYDPFSAAISALSLCLLLRTNSLMLAALTAFVAIFSKQLFRVNGKHVFNPTALALVVVASTFDRVWISPGQWGHTAFLLIAIAAAGSLVSSRATRFETSLSFLGVFTLCVVARAFYLGDPLDIAFHQLSNGALLIFAFFMISDPRTTPSRRGGRIVFATFVALVAIYIEFVLYRANGAIYALVFSAPLVPLIDRLLPLLDNNNKHASTQLTPSSINQPFGVNHV